MSDTATHAMDSYVGIEDPNNLGTFIDVSNKSHNARNPLTKQDVDSSTFGQGDMTNKSGMRDGTFTLDIYDEAAVRTLLFAIYMSKDPVAVRYGPEGSTTGMQYLQADFNMTGWEPGGSVTSLNGSSVSFHRTGGTTLDVFA